jgi:hypothetical protein
MRDATYRVIRYNLPESNIARAEVRYTALAWNYAQAVLLGTRDYASYGEARAALDGMCAVSDVRLRYFDGEYDCLAPDGDLVATAFKVRETCDEVGT